ncbi:PREDICTED: uncharacterized protein LOC108553516 [Eufriesea mexicana]|uniref:uncharacterized protein LOC108553516 n=1 Tax=Eufriesea mexicana TaxID=516756 RepID=UPI00083C84EC|nr:PREDICTED: uncharacterized protein LOC108553516 [Eufriesea mexicana]
MKEHQNMISVYSLLVLVLVLNSVDSSSRQWYKPPRSTNIDYGNVDYPSLMYDMDDMKAPVPPQTNEKWPFRHEKAMKVTRRAVNNLNKELDAIYFPDNEGKQLMLRNGIVPKCNGTTFCENVSEYPTNMINDIIEKNPYLRNYESADAVDIGFRQNTATEVLCLSNEQIVRPQSAENVNNEWLYIFNNSNFTQGILIETCANEGSSCRLVEGFAGGYVTSCRQKYSYRQLVAIGANGSVSHDHFRFPSSCCCHVEFTALSALRLNPTDRLKKTPVVDANAD